MGLSITVASEFGHFVGGMTCRAAAMMASLIVGIMTDLEAKAEAEKRKLGRLKTGMKN